jgi:beta-glucosidase
VLLRNEPVDGRPLLPLDPGRLARVAVLGRLADVANTGDHGSSDVRAPAVVTPLAGLRAALPGVEVSHVDTAGGGAATDPAVAAADAAVVVVGYTAEDEGEYVGSFDPALAVLYPEADDPQALDDLARAWDAGPQSVGGDRDSLRLHPADEELVRAVAAANPRTVVVVLAGAAVTMEAWRREVPAVLVAWYPGMEGGSALADVLLGQREPGGRLPFAIPRDDADLPPFDRNATTVTYDRWHGQRLLDRDGKAAAYPLGFGLSYTSFAIGDVSAGVKGDAVRVRASVANTGERAGGHVVQVYATRPAGDRYLVGFARVEAAPGERVPVVLDVPLRRLASRVAAGTWTVPAGAYRLDVGANAGDPVAVALELDPASRP